LRRQDAFEKIALISKSEIQRVFDLSRESSCKL
jgi:hypothetical protein